MADRYEFSGEITDLLWGQLMLKALELTIAHDLRPTKGIHTNQTTIYARQVAAVELVSWAVGDKMKIIYQEDEDGNHA